MHLTATGSHLKMMYESIPNEASKTNESYAIPMDSIAIDQNEPISKETNKRSDMEKGLGVSLAFGVVGGLFLGPVLGLVLAGGALYTSTREDKYGESVRFCGNSVCELFDKSIDTCRKCKVDDIIPPEQRKHVSETLSSATDQAMKKLQDLDAKFGVTSRASRWLGMKQHEVATLPIASTFSEGASCSTTPLHKATPRYILEDESESKV